MSVTFSRTLAVLCHPTSKVRHVLTSFNWSKAKDTEVEQEFPKCMQVVEHMFPEFCIIS